jgi:branched-subunit amino acid transport protein
MKLEEIILIMGMFAVTFSTRYPLLVLVGRIELPQGAFRALRYVPVAVLTAITIPAMVMPTGEAEVQLDNAYLVGGIAAIGIAWYTKSLLATIILGMIVFLVWRFVIF